MSPPAVAEATASPSLSTRSDDRGPDMEHNENHEQRTAGKQSDDSDKEDAATQAASENLKHTTISDNEPGESIDASAMVEIDLPAHETSHEDSAKQTTPEPMQPSNAQDEEMKERISSPKKKRGREYEDEARDVDTVGSVEEAGVYSNGSAINGGRTTSSAPVKKRHRDTSVDTVVAGESASDAKVGRNFLVVI